MPSTNYAITKFEEGNGNSVFFIKECFQYEYVEEAMPAIIDYNNEGKVFRVEIVYLQDALERLGKALPLSQVKSDTKVVLQVGTNTPVSLLLWVNSLYQKSQSYLDAKARLLQAANGEIVGVKIIIPQ